MDDTWSLIKSGPLSWSATSVQCWFMGWLVSACVECWSYLVSMKVPNNKKLKYVRSTTNYWIPVCLFVPCLFILCVLDIPERFGIIFHKNATTVLKNRETDSNGSKRFRINSNMTASVELTCVAWIINDNFQKRIKDFGKGAHNTKDMADCPVDM